MDVVSDASEISISTQKDWSSRTGESEICSIHRKRDLKTVFMQLLLPHTEDCIFLVDASLSTVTNTFAPIQPSNDDRSMICGQDRVFF